MTTETKSEAKTETTPNTEAEKKSVFSPLGKYAVIAVIMVSIIVTTAIMLEKQLNTVDEQLAAIESTVAQNSSKENLIDNEIAAATETSTTITEETVEIAIITESTNEVTAEIATEAVLTETPTVEASTADVLITTEDASSKQIAHPEAAAQFELARTNRLEQQQARIEAFKLQQKQSMADMFARIKTLEAKQLDQYKSNQEDQIARLRKQISQQNAMIEALVLRNQNHYDLRAANIQRNQSSREQMLNRI